MMMQIEQYFLEYRQAEQERLRRQAQMLAGNAQALFDRLGMFSGAQVVEIGCGPTVTSIYWPSAWALGLWLESRK